MSSPINHDSSGQPSSEDMKARLVETTAAQSFGAGPSRQPQEADNPSRQPQGTDNAAGSASFGADHCAVSIDPDRRYRSDGFNEDRPRSAHTGQAGDVGRRPELPRTRALGETDSRVPYSDISFAFGHAAREDGDDNRRYQATTRPR